MAEVKAVIKATRGNGVVAIELFDGRYLEVDFKRTTMAKLDEELVSFLAEILSRSAWDTLILTNLDVRAIPARAEGKPPIT